MKISTGHLLLTALDHRAATYEKLDQLQLALKDAKEMLELKPDLSKAGYHYFEDDSSSLIDVLGLSSMWESFTAQRRAEAGLENLRAWPQKGQNWH